MARSGGNVFDFFYNLFNVLVVVVVVELAVVMGPIQLLGGDIWGFFLQYVETTRASALPVSLRP